MLSGVLPSSSHLIFVDFLIHPTDLAIRPHCKPQGLGEAGRILLRVQKMHE